LSLFNRISQTFVAKIIQAFIAFGISVFAVKLVGAEGQGNLNIYFTFFLLFSTITFLSIGSATIYFSNKSNDLKNYYSTFFFLAIFLLVLMLVLNYFLSDYVKFFYKNINTENYLILSNLLLITFVISKISVTFSRSSHNSVLFNGAILAEKFFYFLFLLFCFFLEYEITFKTLIISFCFCSFASHLYVIFNFTKYLNFYNIKISLIKEILSFSFKGHIGVVFQKINLKFDVLYLAAILNPVLIGYYSISVLFSQLLLYIPDSIAVFLYPHLSNQKDHKRSLKLCLLTNRVTVFFLIFLTLFISLFGKKIIISLYGQEFHQSFLPLIILLISSLFFATVKILTKFTTAIGHPIIGSRVSFVGICVNIPFLIILVPHYNIVGAALASLFSYFSMFVYLTLWFKNNFSKINFSDILFIKKKDFSIFYNFLKNYML
tara:strand:+ start:1470 stop:2768 length:1299 start_codon:yes stop_codon:yes gene_type:complete